MGCGRRRLLWLWGETVDHFAGAGVVELFPSFVLDGVGVVLEAIDVLLKPGVFVLKFLYLVFELLFLAALAVPDGKAMTAVDHAPRESEGEENGENRSGGTPAVLKPLNGPLRQWKRLGGRFFFLTEQIWVLH